MDALPKGVELLHFDVDPVVHRAVGVTHVLDHTLGDLVSLEAIGCHDPLLNVVARVILERSFFILFELHH